MFGVVALLLLCLLKSASSLTPRPSLLETLQQPQQPPSLIEDTQCTSFELERANDAQLYLILQELSDTAFFRNFAVDLEQDCPLKKRDVKMAESSSSMESSHEAPKDTSESGLSEPPPAEEGEGCAGGLEDLDPEAGPSCGLAEEDPFGAGSLGGTSFGMSSVSSAAVPESDSKSEPESQTDTPVEQKPVEEHDSETTSIDEDDDEDEDEEFECDGGEDLDLDDDAEPLCSLDFGESRTPISDYIMAAALQTIRFLGFESEAQRKTFDWSFSTHPVQSSTESPALHDEHGQDCAEDDASYWNDMCRGIQMGTSGKVVNLALNPERNTGYDGSEIWKAMYQENCLVSGNECYEERVLYKLLSGLHTSTTLSIVSHYYPPSKRKNRTEWESNPTLFWEKFQDHPEYLRNLHFSYVVLLRAIRKAAPYLYQYPIQSGNVVEDETAQILLRRLLDSAILQSCQSVFDAFDETMMFRSDVQAPQNGELISLKANFKGVFHNISSILDCVQCQQCKLHGKMAMLGYGTALKILFRPASAVDDLFLERNEVVALLQTVYKFSQSIKEVRILTNQYWDQNQASVPAIADGAGGGVGDAIGLIASLTQQGVLSSEQESQLVAMAIEGKPELLSLVQYYGSDATKFAQFASSLVSSVPDEEVPPDAIVVGSGLAGLAAALNMLDRGGHIVIMEKEHRLGGNSNKASSGINACCPQNATYGDFLDSFKKDTTKSAGSAAQPELIDVLVRNSASAVSFLKERVGVDLSLLAQLGGHSHKRTHRPSNGMAGAEIIYGMQKAVKAHEKEGRVKIMVDTRVTELVTGEDGAVVGVEYASTLEEGAESRVMKAANVVLATGGFASDRSTGSYLEQYRPELLNMPATAGPFSTGDGITLAKALGADTINMDKVQLHPTGWVDPTDPLNPSKVLAAELMRGVGGILLNSTAQRFCNELGTRAYVTDQMLSHNSHYKETMVWDKENPVPSFALVLSSSAAEDGKKHVDLYSHKGLLTKLEGVSELARWMNVSEEAVVESLRRYQSDAAQGTDSWGKTSFRGVPQEDLTTETFYAGRVTPVLHYCMGGITIDTEGYVLDGRGERISGLHAAGEVTGGVHGNNRLGGNSLLECTVFGTIVGKKLPIQERLPKTLATATPTASHEVSSMNKNREINMTELAQHDNTDDCWIAIAGVVYDMTDFAEEHPAGPQSIHDLCALDGTEAFQAVHNAGILDDFGDERQGLLVIDSRRTNDEPEVEVFSEADGTVSGGTISEVSGERTIGMDQVS